MIKGVALLVAGYGGIMVMKLSCDLEVLYRLARSAGDSKSKKARSLLSIGRKGKDELHLIVSTVKNITGSTYKLKKNVIQIFDKFIKDGKTTIRFSDPAHDLCISNADPVKLKEFLLLLRLSPKEQGAASVAPLLPPKMRDLDKPVTRLSIKSRGEYPIEAGFLSSLERLVAPNIVLTRFDRRIFNLSSLQHLDLSGNVIKVVPEELKDLSLTELILCGNQIKELPAAVGYGTIANTLKVLDLSRNSLTHLPQSFHLFKSLVQLKLDCNGLQVLPRGFGQLQGSLRFLSISSNKLVLLPLSFSRLRLESLDLYGNPFKAGGLVRRCKNLNMPGLMELAARVIKKQKLPYSTQTIPVVLCHYLDSSKKCICGMHCFDAYLHYIAKLDLSKVSSSLTSVDQSGTTSVPIELFLCSAKCLKLWK